MCNKLHPSFYTFRLEIERTAKSRGQRDRGRSLHRVVRQPGQILQGQVRTNVRGSRGRRQGRLRGNYDCWQYPKTFAQPSNNFNRSGVNYPPS